MPLLTPGASGLRLIAICLVTASISLPMAWVSLGKLVLFAGCLSYIALHKEQAPHQQHVGMYWSVRMIFVALTVFALSLLWTTAPIDIALQSFAKHAKLIEIVMLMMLIRNSTEARVALLVYFATQCFFIASSWIMALGVRVPWATSLLVPEYQSVVYSTYLDQTLIFAAAGAVLWHLRAYLHQAPWAAAAFAALALANNLLIQLGRTGYLASFAVMTLAVTWLIPKKWRLIALVLLPIFISVGLYAGSDKFQSRVNKVINESQSFASQGNDATSSGIRLHIWRRSIQAIQERPFTGHGVGSWKLTVERIEGAHADAVLGSALPGNPHQEFLLWGVELGVWGTLLLVAWLIALVWDSRRFNDPIKHALWSVLAVMVVGCLFNSSLYDALIGDFFCVTLGLLLALGLRNSQDTLAPKIPPPEPHHT